MRASTALVAVSLAMAGAAQAQTDGTWVGPGNDWNDGTNWSSSPMVPDNVATFVSNGAPNVLSIGAPTTINTINITGGTYFYNIDAVALNVDAGGITSTSPIFQGFDVINGGQIVFSNGASISSSGTLRIRTLNTGTGNQIQFLTGSNAGTAIIHLLSAANNRLVFDNSSAGSAVIQVLGSLATVRFDNASTADNASIINNGTFDISNNGASLTVNRLHGDGAFYLGGNQLTINNSTTFADTISGVISDCGSGTDCFNSGSTGGSLVKTGTQTLTLSAANTYTGGTTINGGTVQIGDSSALGTNTVTMTSSTLAYATGLNVFNAIVLNDNNNNLSVATGASATQTGGISGGTNGLTKTGGGTLVLAGSNTYTGTTTIAAGTLTVTGGSAIANAGAVVVQSGATFNVAQAETIGSLAGDAGSFVTLTGSLFVGGSTSTTFAGQITGNGGLQIQGSGILTLTGAANNIGNSLLITAGGLTLDGGALTVGGFTQMANAGTTLTVRNGGALTSQNIADIVANGTALVTGAGSTWTSPGGIRLGQFLGPGTLTVADGATVDTGGSVISLHDTSILNIGNGGLAPAAITTGQVTLNDTTQVIANFTDTFTLAADIAGDGSLTKNGTGTLILTGMNGYTGGTTINAGTLQIGNGVVATSGIGGNINIAGAAATLALNKALGTTLQLDGVISGAGRISIDGPGFVSLNANNTYQGGTFISAGTLSVGLDANLGNAAGNVTLSGTGTLQSTGTFASNRGITLSAGANAGIDVTGVNNLTLSGVITGGGNLVKTGSGTLTLAGNNNYSGNTILQAGTLTLGHNNALGVGGTLITQGSVVDYANGVDNAVPIQLASDDTQLQVLAGASATQSGAISQDAQVRPLEKIGGGTLILAGANTYTGDTTVTAGTLTINGSITSSVINNATFVNNGTVTGNLTNNAEANNNGTITGAVTNAAAATFQLSGFGTVGGGLTNSGAAFGNGILNGAIVNQGAGTLTTNGNITGNSSLTNTGTAVLNVTGGNFTGLTTLTNTSTAANGVDVGAGRTLTVSGLVTNGDGVGGSTIRVQAGGILNAGGLLNQAFSIVSNFGTINDDLDNAGLIDNNGAYNATVNTNTGTINNNAAGVWTGDVNSNTGTIINSGTWTTTGTGTPGGFNNNLGGNLTTSNLLDATLGGLTNRGQVDASGEIRGAITNTDLGIFLTGALTGNGTVTNSGTARLVVQTGDFTGITTLTNSSTNVEGVQVLATRTLGATTINNQLGATIANVGTITTTAGITNAGTLNTNTATSVINGGLTNTGAVVAAGQVNGAIQNNGAGTFVVDGALVANNTFTNNDTAVLNVQFGNLAGITTLTNNSTAANAVHVFGGRTLSVANIVNNAGANFFSDGGTVTATGQITNAGSFVASGAINGAIVNQNAGTFVVDGALTGNNTFTNNDTAVLNVQFGNLAGITTLTNNSTAANAVHVFGGRTLSVANIVNNAGANFFSDGGTVTATGQITNAGSFAASGTINGAIVNQNAGTFTVDGALVVNNTFTNNNTAVLNVQFGNFTGITTLTNNSTAANAVHVFGGRALSATNIVNNAGANFFSDGGTVTATGQITNAGSFTASGTINGAIVNQNAGTFVVDGALVANNTFTNSNTAVLNVQFGNFTGITTLTNTSTAAIGVDVGAGRTLTVSGLVTNGNGLAASTIRVQAGGTLNAGGLLNRAFSVVNNFGTINDVLDNAGLINNNGIWNATVNTNTGTINNNAAGVWTGDVNSNAGTIINAGTWTTTGPAGFNVGTGGSLATTNLLDATLGGLTNRSDTAASGEIRGAITNTGGGTFLVAGALLGNNTFTNSDTAQLQVTGGNFTGITTLTNSSTAIPGVFIAAGRTLSATTINNQLGATIQNQGTITTTAGLTNAGTLISNAATSVINGNLTNTGNVFAAGQINNSTIQNNAGVFIVQAPGMTATNSTFNNAGTGYFDVNTGNFTGLTSLTNTATGIGRVDIDNGMTLGVTGAVINGDGVGVSRINLTGASFLNAGSLTNNANSQVNINGALTVTGQVTNSGAITVLTATSSMTAAGVTNNLGGTITNFGTVTDDLDNAGLVDNFGIWNATVNTNTATGVINNNAGATWNGDVNSNTGTITNAGTWNTTGTGTPGGFNNSAGGTLVTSNLLDATLGGLNNAGTVQASGEIRGTILNTGAGTFTTTGALLGNSTFTNSGTAQLAVTGGNFTGITTLTNTSTAAVGVNVTGFLLSTTGLVTNGDGATASTMQVGAGGTLTGGGGFSNLANSTINLTTATSAAVGNLANAGTVTNSGTWTGNVTANTGSLTNNLTWVGNITTSNTFLNAGTGTVAGNVTNSATATNNGIIAGTFSSSAGTAGNAGTINGLATVTGGTLTSTGTLGGGLTNSATVLAQGTANGTITNSGALTLTGALTGNGAATNTGAGVTAVGGNSFTGLTSFTNTAGGTTTLTNGGTLGAGAIANNAASTIGITGTATLGGAVTNAGTLALANTATVANITGSLTGNAGNSITVPINLTTGVAASVAATGAAAGTNNVAFGVTGGGSLFAPITITNTAGGGSGAFTGAGLPASVGLVNYTYTTSGPNQTVVTATPNAGAITAPMTSIMGTLSSIEASFHQSASALVASPQSPEPNKWSGGVWSRGSGGYSNVTSTGTASILGVNTQSSTKIDTRFAGYQVGLDGALLNVGNSGWNAHLGVTAGDVEAKSNDRFTSVNFTSGRFVGVYAVFTRGAFFSDIGYRHTNYDAEVTSSIANLSKTALKGRGDNINASAGYQFRFGDHFIEPSAGISVTRSTFDNIGSTVAGNPYTLAFNELKSTLARIGVRAGFTSVVQNMVALSPFITGSVWHEFETNAGGLFTTPFALGGVVTTATVPITTDRVGTFYQAGAGVSAQVLNTGFLAFVRGDFRIGNKLDAASLHAGARYTFGP